MAPRPEPSEFMGSNWKFSSFGEEMNHPLTLELTAIWVYAKNPFETMLEINWDLLITKVRAKVLAIRQGLEQQNHVFPPWFKMDWLGSLLIIKTGRTRWTFVVF